MLPSHTVTNCRCQYGRLGWPCPGFGITFCPLSQALGRGGEVAHINVLELWAVRLMLLNLGQTLLSQVIWIESDNAMMVAYINKEGVHSQALNHETMLLYEWVIPMGAQMQAVHWPGVDNIFLLTTCPRTWWIPWSRVWTGGW